MRDHHFLVDGDDPDRHRTVRSRNARIICSVRRRPISRVATRACGKCRAHCGGVLAMFGPLPLPRGIEVEGPVYVAADDLPPIGQLGQHFTGCSVNLANENAPASLRPLRSTTAAGKVTHCFQFGRSSTRRQCASAHKTADVPMWATENRTKGSRSVPSCECMFGPLTVPNHADQYFRSQLPLRRKRQNRGETSVLSIPRTETVANRPRLICSILHIRRRGH